ncbi:MAG: hypothetical protein ACRDRR_02600 [Pseudonocardiaceae bacterium]
MYYPDPPSVPTFPPFVDEADGLLAEVYQAQAALRIAEYHIRLWRANSATGNMSFRAYRSYAAHEAVHEAGEVIGRIAEMLRIEVIDTLTIPHQGNSAQIITEVSPTDPVRREPACSDDHDAHRERVSIVQRVGSGGVK